jgi:hypothetical protein
LNIIFTIGFASIVEIFTSAVELFKEKLNRLILVDFSFKPPYSVFFLSTFGQVPAPKASEQN